MIAKHPAKIISTAFVICFFSTYGAICQATDRYGPPAPNIKTHLDRLVKSYPDWISGYDETHIILRNGKRFPLSDGRTDKTFEELLETPDIDDMFFAVYPVGSDPKQHPKNFDPGRVRFEPLFVTMYGDCRKNEVEKHLRTIKWLPKHGDWQLRITKINGVDKALERVSRDLDELPPQFLEFLTPSAGTYNCRMIAGSNSRSMHAYGAAIDVNTKFADYWRWVSKIGDRIVWRNRIPIEIIRIFERHGFIWGGHWYHFDTMHFEYRPELLPRKTE